MRPMLVGGAQWRDLWQAPLCPCVITLVTALEGSRRWGGFRTCHPGKERETSLGPFPELGLAEAREKHAELRKMVKVDRADPIA
jgi:hypothetical protein